MPEIFDSLIHVCIFLQGLELDIDRFDIQTVKIAGDHICFLTCCLYIESSDFSCSLKL